MHSLNDDFYVLTGKIFCRLLNTHPAPQVLIYSGFFDIPDQVDHDQKKCRCFIDTLIWLRDNSYIRYSQLLAVGALMSSSRKNALSAQCHADLSAAPARTI